MSFAATSIEPPDGQPQVSSVPMHSGVSMTGRGIFNEILIRVVLKGNEHLLIPSDNNNHHPEHSNDKSFSEMLPAAGKSLDDHE